MVQFILIGMCVGIKISTISPLFTSKCQHGQYRTLKVEYLSPMSVFTKILLLCSQLPLNEKHSYRRWESSGLKCITQNPTKREAYIDGRFDEHKMQCMVQK